MAQLCSIISNYYQKFFVCLFVCVLLWQYTKWNIQRNEMLFSKLISKTWNIFVKYFFRTLKVTSGHIKGIEVLHTTCSKKWEDRKLTNFTKSWDSQSCMLCGLFNFSCHWQHSTSCVCVETHLGGENKHSNLDTRTTTPHAQTQMKHNSSPPVGGMVVGLMLENQSRDLRQWWSPPVEN